MKVCSMCGENKEESEFYARRTGKLQSNCKKCHRQCTKKYEQSSKGKATLSRLRGSDEYWNDPSNRYSRAKASIKKSGRELLMTKEEYWNIANSPCHYCNDLLDNEKKRGIGLDRVDNNKTYTIDNVLPCCGFCNKTRGDRLTVYEMEKVAQFLIELRKTNTL